LHAVERVVPTGHSFLLTGGAAGLALLVGIGSVQSPVLALAGVGAVAFTLIVARSMAAALALFVLLTFFDRTTMLQSIGLTTPVKLAGGVLALIWLLVILNRSASAPVIFREHGIFALVVAFFVTWALASALWAAQPHDALASGFRLAQGVILLFIVSTAIRNVSHARWLILAFIGGALLATVIGFFGAYGANASVNDARLSGGFDDPNELAAVVVPALVFLGFVFEAYRRSARLLLIPAAGVLGLGFVRTDSQAGLLALGVVCICALFFSGPARGRAVALVTTLVIAGTAYYTLVTAPVAFQTLTSSNNVGGRESLWAVAGDVVADHPLLGVGAGNFSDAEQSYAFGSTSLPRVDLVARGELVHNSYLQVLAELGPVGLAAFLAVIVGSLALGVRAARSFHRVGDREMELLARGVVIGTVGILVAYFFATNQYEKQLWLLLAIGPALDSIARRASAQSPAKEQGAMGPAVPAGPRGNEPSPVGSGFGPHIDSAR
jgi:O-antigen ligase